MNIVISGGTGFIGVRLCDTLSKAGHTVRVLSRNPHREKKSTDQLQYIYWDPSNPVGLQPVIEEADAVVNLAGESIGTKRWTPARKKQILESRLQSTFALVSAITTAGKKPSVMVSTSAIGIYDHTKEAVYDESSETGSDFLAEVCTMWEREARKAEQENVRVTIVRFGIVLGKSGGALQRMLLPFKLFAGGPLGSGKQWMQWIHIDDVVGIIRFALENENVSGVLNATSPNQVTNKEFSKVLGKVLRRPSFMPAPAFALRIMLGEMADTLLLNGQQVLPERTRELGYSFQYTDLEPALRNIMKK